MGIGSNSGGSCAVRKRRWHSSLAAAVVAACAGTAGAAALTWDAAPGTAGLQDGSGTWDTSTAEWFNGTTDVAWANSPVTDAIFGVGDPLGTAGPFTVALGAPITAGNLTFNFAGAGNAYTISGGAGNNVLTLSGTTPSVTTNVSGTISAVLAGTSGLRKLGSATLTLNPASVETYTGTTAVDAGTLLADFTNLATPTNLIDPSSALSLGGGTMTIKGQASATSSQQFASWTLASGASSVTRDTTASGSLVNVTLNGLTTARPRGATINFSPDGNGSTFITTANTANTILGGWATVGGTDWAVSAGDGTNNGAVTALATYQTANTPSSWLTTDDVSVSATPAASAGTQSINSLRFTTGASTLTIGTGNVLTINSGGLLENPSVGSGAVTITGGTLSGAAGADLIVFQNNTSSSLSIASVIANNSTATGVTKSGAGTLVLQGANTYTGPTTINAGVVQFASDGATAGAASPLGAVPSAATPGNIVLNGGTLTNTAGLTLAANRGIAVGFAGGTLADTNSGNFAISGVIADAPGQSGAITVQGPGTGLVVFSAANTYSGGTTLTAGSFSVVSASSGGTAGNPTNGSFGTGVLNLAGGALRSTTGGNRTINNNAFLSGSTRINSAGGSDTSLTFAGTVTIAGGTQTISVDAMTPATSGPVISGAIGDNGDGFGLTKAGAGILTLSGVNTYTGLTSVTAGTLRMGASGVMSGGALTVNGATAIFDLGANHTETDSTVTLDGGGQITGTGTSALTATTAFAVKAGSETANLAGAVALTKTNTAALDTTVTLSGINTYTGKTNVAAGFLNVSVLGLDGETASSLGAPTGATNRSIVFTGDGQLTYTGAATTTDHPIDDSAGGGTNALNASGTGKLTWTGALTGAHSFTFGGTSIGEYQGVIGDTAGLVHKNGTGTWIFSGNNTYTVPLSIDGGVLSVATVNKIGTTGVFGNSSSPISMSNGSTSGTLQYTGASNGTTDHGLTLASATAPGIIDITTAGVSLTFTGAITSGVAGAGLTQIDPGTLILVGNNTYSGATAINGGLLLAKNTAGSATGSGAVNVGDGTTHNGSLAGTGSISGPVTVNAGSTISAGDGVASPGLLTLNTTGGTTTTTFNGGGIYSVKINDAAGGAGSSTGWDKLVTNLLAVNAGTGGNQNFTIQLASFSGGSSGNANNFVNTNSYVWPIAQISGQAFTGQSVPPNLLLDTSRFTNPTAAGFSFQLAEAADPTVGTDLEIVYSPAPEPTSFALFTLAAGACLARRRRKA
jgi:fibronectin-binding autotransporter adhesin